MLQIALEKVKDLENKLNEITLNAVKAQENPESEYTEIESNQNETQTKEEPKVSQTEQGTTGLESIEELLAKGQFKLAAE